MNWETVTEFFEGKTINKHSIACALIQNSDRTQFNWRSRGGSRSLETRRFVNLPILHRLGINKKLLGFYARIQSDIQRPRAQACRLNVISKLQLLENIYLNFFTYDFRISVQL